VQCVGERSNFTTTVCKNRQQKFRIKVRHVPTSSSWDAMLRRSRSSTSNQTKSPTRTPVHSPTSSTHPTRSPTETPVYSPTASTHPDGENPPQNHDDGLTKRAKIGIAVGVSLGVVALVGAIVAYILGRRRGSKRRVDDPTAGAGKLIRDPSNELNIPPPTPAVAELPSVASNEWGGPLQNASTWWKPFGRTSTKKYNYTGPPNAPQSPQELPA
jgi:hypothetical protein